MQRCWMKIKCISICKIIRIYQIFNRINEGFYGKRSVVLAVQSKPVFSLRVGQSRQNHFFIQPEMHMHTSMWMHLHVNKGNYCRTKNRAHNVSEWKHYCMTESMNERDKINSPFRSWHLTMLSFVCLSILQHFLRCMDSIHPFSSLQFFFHQSFCL